MTPLSTFVINWDALPAVLLAGLLFGVIYNWLVGWLTNRGWHEGFVWLEVVVGVAVTLILSTYLIGLNAALAVTAVFFATGIPMSIGDIWREWGKGRNFRSIVKGKRL